jgi:hypothetical protein
MMENIVTVIIALFVTGLIWFIIELKNAPEMKE